MKLRTYQLIILCVFLIVSCENYKTDTLEKQIKKIDEISVDQSLYVIQIDSNKNRIDTLALRKLKYDDDKNLIFENNIQLKLNIETINYYDTKNGMIYSEVKKNNKLISEFRVNLENDLIVSASYNIYENDITESVFMKYYYTFDEGKKTELLIDSGDDFNTIELYNELEKPILNISMYKNDTLEKNIFIYDRNNLIKKKKVKNFSRDEEIIYEYNKGFIVKESFFSNGIEEFYTEYYKDKQGNYLSYTNVVKDSI